MNLLNYFIRNKKFRSKMIWIYFCVGIIPLIIVGIFIYHESFQTLSEQEKSRIEDYLSQYLITMDNQIEIYNNLSNYVSFNQTVSKVIRYPYESSYEMYTDFSKTLEPLLASLKYFHNEIKRITIYSGNHVVKYNNIIAPISEIEEEAWFSEVQEDNHLLWYASEEKKEIFSVRRIPTLGDEAKLGILYLSIDYDKFFQQFQKMGGSNYGIFVLDGQGNSIYEYSEFDEENQHYQLEENQFREKQGKKSEYYTIQLKSEQNAWTIALYKPSQLIYQSIYPVIWFGVGLFLLCIIFSISVIRLLTKAAVKDIEQLRDNMKEVEEGILEIHVTSQSKDEIGDLVRGFGKMLTQIKVLIEEVYEGKIRQKDYEMKALQAQINPHFLYNTLSLINWKAIEADQEDISKITLALSSFYRTALNKGNNILSFEDELQNTRSYLDIQLMMHDYEFDVEMDIEEEIKKYKTLNLILQPMVENAIDHGIDLKTDGRGKITITGKYESGRIVLTVEDNGVGMDEETSQAILTKKSKGYGIRNVNERIKLYYGEQGQMRIKSEMGKGTCITLRIPAQKE